MVYKIRNKGFEAFWGAGMASHRTYAAKKTQVQGVDLS